MPLTHQLGRAAQDVSPSFEAIGYPSINLLVLFVQQEGTVPAWGPLTPGYAAFDPKTPDGPPAVTVSLVNQWDSAEFLAQLDNDHGIFIFEASEGTSKSVGTAESRGDGAGNGKGGARGRRGK